MENTDVLNAQPWWITQGSDEENNWEGTRAVRDTQRWEKEEVRIQMLG